MKRILIFVLALVLAFGMAGCKKQDTGIVSSQPAQAGDNGTADSTPAADTGAPAVTAPENPKLDLNLEKAAWSTVNPEIGSPVELKLTVVNTGIDAVEGFDYSVRILKDGTEWKKETRSYSQTLYSGNKTKIEVEYTFQNEGKYNAEVYIDEENKLGEKNRFNNVQISVEATAAKARATPTSSGGDETDDSGSCVDTDEGKDELTKGECDDGVTLGISDYCANSNTVKEYYCSSGTCKTEDMPCDSGCEDGACI